MSGRILYDWQDNDEFMNDDPEDDVFGDLTVKFMDEDEDEELEVGVW